MLRISQESVNLALIFLFTIPLILSILNRHKKIIQVKLKPFYDHYLLGPILWALTMIFALAMVLAALVTVGALLLGDIFNPY
jgi:hypothetical protein